MIEGDASFPVNRPPAEVFERLTHPEAALEVAPGAATVTRLSDAPTGLGSRYEIEVPAMGRKEKGTLEVVEWEDGRALTYEAKSGPGGARIRFEVAPDGGGSTVVCRYQVKLSGMARLMEPVLRRMIASNEKLAVARVRRALQA